MNYLCNFFAGAFLCNCIPHLASGLQGKPFPTPFAKPRGIGESSPLMNFFWGFFNAVMGLLLLTCAPVRVGLESAFLATLAGALVLGTYLALHFGKHRNK